MTRRSHCAYIYADEHHKYLGAVLLLLRNLGEGTCESRCLPRAGLQTLFTALRSAFHFVCFQSLSGAHADQQHTDSVSLFRAQAELSVVVGDAGETERWRGVQISSQEMA